MPRRDQSAGTRNNPPFSKLLVFLTLFNYRHTTEFTIASVHTAMSRFRTLLILPTLFRQNFTHNRQMLLWMRQWTTSHTLLHCLMVVQAG